MEQLRKKIEALMSENEAVKSNAMKITTTGMDCEDRASIMYCNARRENIAYQNVLDEMDKIVAGRIAEGGR